MAQPSLPSAPLIDLGQNVVLQPPLSRCGCGPGLVILRPGGYAQCQRQNDSLDPEPLQKWAEESYTVAQITLNGTECADKGFVLERVNNALRTLRSQPQCSSDESFGFLGMLVLCGLVD